MSRNARRRNRLLRREATCHWCGVAVVYVHAREWAKGTMPPNFATLDHLDDRLSCPDRQHRPLASGERTVLACLACNLRRNRDQQRALALEATNRSAGHENGRRDPATARSDQSVTVALAPSGGPRLDRGDIPS